MTDASRHWRAQSYGVAVVTGLAYGMAFQILARHSSLQELMGVMSLGFVFLLPLAIGFVTVYLAQRQAPRSILFSIFAPLPTALACLVAAMVLGWEGFICLILATPVYLVCAMVGGAIGRAIASLQGGVRLVAAGFVMLSPGASAMVESGMPLPREARRADTEIVIHASRETIWQNIITVAPIHEPLSGVFYRIGFPRPIEATLSHPGVGGVRHARFEKNLTFIETVDTWQPLERLSFGIAVDPSQTPLTTLDQHVTVGGEFFDVMRGTYWLEQRDEDDVVLHLQSEFRLSTNFNAYAGAWGGFLMRDIQTSILGVIKMRCEAKQ